MVNLLLKVLFFDYSTEFYMFLSCPEFWLKGFVGWLWTLWFLKLLVC